MIKALLGNYKAIPLHISINYPTKSYYIKKRFVIFSIDLGFFSFQGIKIVKKNKGYLYIFILLQVTVPFIKLVRRTGKKLSKTA